jgi:hypothetical protein
VFAGENSNLLKEFIWSNIIASFPKDWFNNHCSEIVRMDKCIKKSLQGLITFQVTGFAFLPIRTAEAPGIGDMIDSRNEWLVASTED